MFKKISEAYTVLSDPKQKREYDNKGTGREGERKEGKKGGVEGRERCIS